MELALKKKNLLTQSKEFDKNDVDINVPNLFVKQEGMITTVGQLAPTC